MEKLSEINLNNYQPLRDVIFNTLREAIIIGELKPGERLMEIQLAEKLGVSRTPVREAIRKLELEGLVKMAPRKGAYVADITQKEIKDVLEIRAYLDGLASRLAAERISDEEIKQLEKVCNVFKKYKGTEDFEDFIKKDIEFHDIIYQGSKNNRLISIAENLREQIQRFRVIYVKKYNIYGYIAEEHGQIFSAIKNRNGELAEKVAFDHIIKQEKTILKQYI